MANYPKIATIGAPGVEIDRIIEIAKDAEMVPAYYAIMRESELSSRPQLWPEPSYKDDDDDNGVVNLGLTNKADFITRLAMEISDSVKFPISSAHLYSLGCIAAAMTKSFSVEYKNGKFSPCNLFVVVGQPPSTGKSGINEILFDPVLDEFEKLNKSTVVTRVRLQNELAIAEKNIDKISNGKGSGDYHELDIAITKMEDVKESLAKYPNWVAALDDATIEAVEGLAARQQGVFNIVSAEAEALDVLLGSTYANKEGKKNFKLVLNAWDGERTSSARVTREGYTGRVRASIAVISQNKTIESMMHLGKEGRGLPERFLLLCEDDKLGERKHVEVNYLDTRVMSDYQTLIANIVNETSINLVIPPKLRHKINVYRDEIEPLIATGGDYDSAMLTGFIGKADKHINKLACVYHVADEWGVKGQKNKEVSERAIVRAISVFDEMRKQYARSAIEYGFTGDAIQILAIVEYLRFQVTRNKRLKIQWREFKDGVKGKSAFQGSRNVTKKIKDDLLPKLELNFFCRLHKGIVHINPRLK